MKDRVVRAVFTAAVIVVGCGNAAGEPVAVPAPEIKVTVDPWCQLLPVGKEAKVSVLVNSAGKPAKAGLVEVKLTLDGGSVSFGTFTNDLAKANPFTFTRTLDRSGFLYGQLAIVGGNEKDRRNRKDFSVAFDPWGIREGAPEPKDFDAFWRQALEKQAAVKDPVKLTPISKPEWDPRFDYFDVEIRTASPAGRNYGVMGVPKGRKGPFSALVICQAWGGGYGCPEPNYVRDDLITLALSCHAQDPCDPKWWSETYPHLQKDVWPHGSYILTGLEKRETFYFYNSILGAVQAVDYLRARPDFNGDLYYEGGSQGGTFGLYLGGLRPGAFKAIAVQNPGFCDFCGADQGRRSTAGEPYTYWKRIHPEESDASMRERLGVFDACYFAKRITDPILFLVSYRDDCCYASTVYAAYNNVPRSTVKFIVNGRDRSHSWSWEHMNDAWQWLQNFMPPAPRAYRKYWAW